MAIYHLSAKIVSRANGQSAVASSAYRSGEKLKCERDGLIKNYTDKENVKHSEIAVPVNAPEWANNREQLWNEVEKIEKGAKAQLARTIDIALPIELNLEQHKELGREFAQSMAAQGMVFDWSIHYKFNEQTGILNPHIDGMATMRQFKEDGTWDVKQRKQYILDKNGNKQYDKKTKTYKCTTVKATDWDDDKTLEKWRDTWEKLANKHLERAGIDQRIDHRSNAERGLESLPTIHLGTDAHAMEERGIRTDRGDINRAIKEYNAEITKPAIIDATRYQRNIELQLNIDLQCKLTGRPPNDVEKKFIVYSKIMPSDRDVAIKMMSEGVDQKTMASLITKYSPEKPPRSDDAQKYANNLTKSVSNEINTAIKTQDKSKLGGGGGMQMGGGRDLSNGRAIDLSRLFSNPGIAPLLARVERDNVDFSGMTPEQIETYMAKVASEKD